MKAGATDNSRWTSGAVLLAVGEALRGQGGCDPMPGAQFSSADLAAWLPKMPKPQRWEATKRLADMGLLTARMQFAEDLSRRQGHYTLTAAGAAAVAAAAQGRVPKSGPKGTHPAHLRAAPAGSFAARLWALVRMRQVIDTDTAASTLVDAGSDFARARKSASHYLRTWCKLGVLTEGARRVNQVGKSNGNKCYVLARDCGPTPPIAAQLRSQSAAQLRANAKVAA